MKKEILEQIKKLGGNIDHVKGNSLQEDLQSITFDTVLYKRRTDTPWATAEEEEPIYGIADFVNENEALFNEDKEAFEILIRISLFAIVNILYYIIY